MATEWRVTYKNGRTQIITAEKYGPVGDNHVFESDGVDIAVIDRKDVESVMRADIPGPEGRDPIIA